jgi:hypothetical protein
MVGVQPLDFQPERKQPLLEQLRIASPAERAIKQALETVLDSLLSNQYGNSVGQSGRPMNKWKC